MRQRTRANKEGTIYRNAAGRYIAQVTVGYDARGKIVRKSRSCATHADARKALREMQDMYSASAQIDESVTFIQWSEKCAEVYLKPVLRQGSFNNYRYVIKALARHPVARVKLIKLRDINIREYINSLTTGDGNKHQQLARIKAMLRIAVDNGLILVNPADKVHVRYQPQAKSIEFDAAEVLKKLEGHPQARLAALIMLYSGLRRGEVCALQWNDYSSRERTLRINKSIALVAGGGFGVSKTKTEKSNRIVYIPKLLADELDRIRRESKTLGGYIVNYEGRYYLPATFSRDMKRYTGIGTHQLRHYYASFLVRNGVTLKAVQEILGHSNIQTTLNIYAHVLDSEKVRAAEIAAGIG